MESKIHYEVYTSTEEGGTETIAVFEVLEEAEQFISDNADKDLWVDMWRDNEKINWK